MKYYFIFLIVILLINSQQGCKEKCEDSLLTIEELQDLQKSGQAEQTNGKEKIWGDDRIQSVNVIERELLYSDDFENLSNWQHEGIGALDQPDTNLLQLNCIGAKQGAAGCMAFCKKDFPDSIIIEYALKVLSTNGLVINFLAFQGRHGEDMLVDLPAREGIFADYVYNPEIRGYHVSVSRYDDTGQHTGVSNWRRNPGLFLMAQQEDLCKEPLQWYQIRIVKMNGTLQMWVNDHFSGGFKDLDQIPEPIPGKGKIGFRAIGKNVVAQFKGFKVYAIDNE
ncbi:DUF1961 family protein [Bacteroidota bacterium]